LGAGGPSLWETGTKPARLALLTCLRGSDPARARELIVSTWKQENASDRAAFTAAFVVGLSIADEPFLDNALADRSEEVARAAADLLARLPESRYSRRMAERATNAVRFRRNLLLRWIVEIDVPEKLDEALLADRLVEKSPHALLGERAWLLSQIVGAAPLSIWRPAGSPADLIGAVERDEWANAIMLGWSTALTRHPDPAWAEALARHWLRRGEASLQSLIGLPDLAAFPDVAEKLIVDLLGDKQPLSDQSPALSILQSYDGPWSLRLSRAVLQSLEKRVKADSGATVRTYGLQSAFGRFALRMPAEMAPEMEAAFTPDLMASSPIWANPIEKMIQKLQFRRGMLAAVSEGE
jgi:hypothetical protein